MQMLQSQSQSQSHYHECLFTSRHNQQETVEAAHGCVSVTIPDQVTQNITKPFLNNAETDKCSFNMLYSKRNVQHNLVHVYSLCYAAQAVCRCAKPPSGPRKAGVCDLGVSHFHEAMAQGWHACRQLQLKQVAPAWLEHLLPPVITSSGAQQMP